MVEGENPSVSIPVVDYGDAVLMPGLIDVYVSF